MYICIKQRNQKHNIMETAMRLAMETVAELTNRTFNEVANECLNGNSDLFESVKMLMVANR